MKKEDICSNFLLYLILDEEVAVRPPNQAKATLDDSTSDCWPSTNKTAQKWANRCVNTTVVLEKQYRIREVLPESGFA